MTILAPSCFIGSSSLLQVTRACIQVCIRLNFGQIPPSVLELVANERLKDQCLML